MNQIADTNGHDAAFFHSTADVVICRAAHKSGEEITIMRARADHHYRGGNMDGGEENIIRPDNTDICIHCNKCIS